MTPCPTCGFPGPPSSAQPSPDYAGLIQEAKDHAYKATMLASFSTGGSRNALLNFGASFKRLATALEALSPAQGTRKD